jgi:hypothetical protein
MVRIDTANEIVDLLGSHLQPKPSQSRIEPRAYEYTMLVVKCAESVQYEHALVLNQRFNAAHRCLVFEYVIFIGNNKQSAEWRCFHVELLAPPYRPRGQEDLAAVRQGVDLQCAEKHVDVFVLVVMPRINETQQQIRRKLDGVRFLDKGLDESKLTEVVESLLRHLQRKAQILHLPRNFSFVVS